ncbi:MAG: hypothetical protein INR69_09575 [Mucilaginibacter polytrichastri]|nr:hypothetical protein [Mucilaginibacter polytrichastri]
MSQKTGHIHPLRYYLSEVYLYLRAYRYVLIISVLLCLLLACMYQLLTRPVYQINSIVQLDPASSKNPGEKGRLDLRTKKMLHLAMEESPLLVRYVVNDYGRKKEVYRDQAPISLEIKRIDPAAYGSAGGFTISGGDDGFRISGANISGRYGYDSLIRTPDVDFIVQQNRAFYSDNSVYIYFNNPEKLAKEYAGRLNIKRRFGERNTLVISVLDSHPQKGIDLLNELAHLYETLKPMRNTAQEMLVLRDSLKQLNTDLAKMEVKKAQLIQVREEPGTQHQAIRKPVSARQRSALNVISEYLSQPANEFVQLPDNYDPGDSGVRKLIRHYNTLQIEKQKNGGEKGLADIRKQLLTRVKDYSRNGVPQAAEPPVKYAVKKASADPVLLTQIGEKRKEKQQILARIEAGKKSANADAAPSIRMIGKPSLSRAPVVFEATLLFLGALLFGLIIPMPVIYLKNVMTKNVLSLSDIGQRTKMPVLGYVSHHGGSLASRNTIADFGRYRYEFSVLKKALLKQFADDAPRVILVSSMSTGEGRSYIAHHLSALLAGEKKSAVFVDMNLMAYAENAHAGVLNYISDIRTGPKAVIQFSDKNPQLAFIGAGTLKKKKVAEDLPFYQWEADKKDRDRMSSPRVATLIRALRKQFDYVVIDAPPLTGEYDTSPLYKLADVQLHVLRYNFTKKAVLPQLDAALAKMGGEKGFIVLNDIRNTSPQFYRLAHPA